MNTLSYRIAEALAWLGEEEVESRSSKVRTFTRTFTMSAPPTYYYVGRNGSVRVGHCYSDSLAVPEAIKKLILARDPRLRAKVANTPD